MVKEFGGQAVLKGITLDIRDGEIMVLLGASGAGKSVLLQHMIGLLRPDRGAIKIDGTDITKLKEKALLKIRKNIGYLFQEGALYDFMSVYDNVAFPLREHTPLKDKVIDQKVRQALEMVGLKGSEDKMPNELSGGMKKRAALARAIIMNSRILFCDEPTSGLDPLRSRDIWDLIRDIARKLSCTTVITSHDLKNSLRVADRLALLHQGKVHLVGQAEDLLASADQVVKEFVE